MDFLEDKIKFYPICYTPKQFIPIRTIKCMHAYVSMLCQKLLYSQRLPHHKIG